MRKHIKIVNGRILNENYERDFHSFVEDNILIIYVLLPGMKKYSFNVKVGGYDISIKANLEKEYYKIFEAKEIQITGSLSSKVIPGVMAAEYNSGILKISLAIDNDNL